MSFRLRGIAEKWLRRLVRVEQGIAIGLLGVILVSMGSQIIARYVFGKPLSWSEEVARLAMIWLTFTAAGFVAARNQHIAVDLFAGGEDEPEPAGSEAPAKAAGSASSAVSKSGWRRWLSWLLDPRLTSALVLLTTLTLLIGGAMFVWRVHPVGSPGTGISKSVWYGAASFGLALISIHMIADLFGCKVARGVDPDLPAPAGPPATPDSSKSGVSSTSGVSPAGTAARDVTS
jgi:TRAP-type C4-dicarboxylate transport system permease small subunit